MTVTVDNYTRALLTVIAVLLLLVGVGLWYEAPATVSPAYGRILDSGQQLDKVIQKLDDIRVSVEKLQVLMTSGKVKVEMVSPGEVKASPKVTQKSQKAALPAPETNQ